MKTFAVDYESYYDKDCTITNGLENYLNHPDFEAYMVSIYGDNFAWVGHPSEAPWDEISGHGTRWLAHNRSFDEAVHRHLGHPMPEEWHCTADMAAYRGVPRSLKESSKELLGLNISKDVRDNMKGKKWANMDAEFRREVALYALGDSKLCYKLWEQEGENWPEWERRLSQETTRMCWAGLPVNVGKMDVGIEALHQRIVEARTEVPWADEEATLSSLAFGRWCREHGLEPPASMAKDNPDTLKWCAENPRGGEILEHTWTVRGGNSLLKKLQSMRSRVRKDGSLGYGLKYFGAHTGRDSGDAGFNVQNMQRGEMYGVNLREMIEAREGRVLLVADLSQIEARVVAWLARADNLLQIARGGGDWYEAMARAFGLYADPGVMKKVDPGLRQTMKSMCLGCQYGMRGAKFAAVAKLESEAEGDRLVELYRRLNPEVVKLWTALDRGARAAGRRAPGDRDFVIDLPSGRAIRYRDIQCQRGLSAVMPRGGAMMRQRIWFGTIVENITQALARDIFMDRVLALVDAGWLPILRVHDEVVFEVDKAEELRASREIEEIMTTAPSWIPSLPLGTEVLSMGAYTK